MKKSSFCLKQEQFKAEWIDQIGGAFAFKLLLITDFLVSVHFGRLVLVTKVWFRNRKNAVTQLLW